jgi:DNA-binding CsgD family transcriptional regulator
MEHLLERESELARIAELVAVARAGEGAYAVIQGPAGIGKTELVEAARALGREQGLQVLSARGGELEIDFPYGVVQQIFEPVLAAATARDRRSLLAGAAAAATSVLAPDSRSSEMPSEEGVRLFAALHALYWLTVNVASRAPVLLTVDDAHWADTPSLRFLLYLRPRLEGVPLLLVAALRTGEPVRDARLVTQLTVTPPTDLIQPAPLTETAVAEIIREALPVVPDRSLAAACHAATGGNPFLLLELSTALAAEGIESARAATDRVANLGPATVARSILVRLARLPPAAAALAQAVAVLGGEAELRHAAALAELDEQATAEGVDALVGVQILEPGVPLAFVHPLVRAAVYSDLPPGVRMNLHARAAQLLANDGATPDAVAAHLVETEPAGKPETVAYLRRAAGRAMSEGAPEVAANQLRRALVEPPAEEERRQLLRELGAAELLAGQPEAGVEHLYQALRESSDADARTEIGLLLRTCLVIVGRMDEAVAVSSQVIDELELEEMAYEPVLEAGAVGAALLNLSVASRMTDRVERLRRRATDPDFREPLGLAVAGLATAHANEPADAAAELAMRALDGIGQAHASGRYPAEAFLTMSLTAAERFDLAAKLAQELVEAARRRGFIPELVVLMALRSRIAYRCGRLADAEKDARDAVETIGLYGQEAYFPLTLAALLDPLIERGELEEAETLLDRTSLASGYEESWYFSLLVHARGRLRMAQGRVAAALEDFRWFRRFDSPVTRSPCLWSWRSDAALALLALGEEGDAERLAYEELELGRAFRAPRTLGVALRAAGLVAGGRARLDLLREAVTVLEDSPASLEHARALTDLGAALRRANRRSEAREPLRHGFDQATRCGADVLAARAREELAATGARPRKAHLTGLEALTASERRIAEMAAKGLSNPEIAQALFLTRRTVETHLTHVYQKLDIASRDQLPGALGAELTGSAS